MSRYGANFTGPAYSKRYRAPKPLARFAHKMKGGRKATELYSDLHDAWRAGAIRDFYYGARSPQDPTIVWEVNGVEGEPEEIRETLTERLHMAGIESIVIGAPWCGYPSMTVTYSDGSVLSDSYDGCSRVEMLTREGSDVVDDLRLRAQGREAFPELNGLAAF